MKIKYILILATLFIIIIFQLNFKVIKIYSDSMYPTLKDGDYALLYLTKKINRNDIVVFSLNNEFYIKRVIGLPKDTIKITNNRLVINNSIINENYINKKYVLNYFNNNKSYFGNNYIVPFIGFETKLNGIDSLKYHQLINTIENKSEPYIKNNIYKFKTNTYYILGDNRKTSKDSRYFGSIPKNQIKGKLILFREFFEENISKSR